MKRPVRWTREALDDIKKQIGFIARDNKSAALQVADRIRDTAAGLGRRAVGRTGRVTETYEKTVLGLPYIIAYSLAEQQVGGEAVVILRVIHTARDWPSDGWPD